MSNRVQIIVVGSLLLIITNMVSFFGGLSINDTKLKQQDTIQLELRQSLTAKTINFDKAIEAQKLGIQAYNLCEDKYQVYIKGDTAKAYELKGSIDTKILRMNELTKELDRYLIESGNSAKGTY